MKKAIFCIPLMLLGLSGCSEVTYKNLLRSQTDPELVFNKGTTVGLVPMYWVKGAKESNIDQLSEKVLLSYFKKELEKKGGRVN